MAHQRPPLSPPGPHSKVEGKFKAKGKSKGKVKAKGKDNGGGNGRGDEKGKDSNNGNAGGKDNGNCNVSNDRNRNSKSKFNGKGKGTATTSSNEQAIIIAPRLKSTKQQSRFYEALILLAALDPTRGDHIPGERLPSSSLAWGCIKAIRREFLRELAYVCAYAKGGDTVTAIALEATPAETIFWVATNTDQEAFMRPYLDKLLPDLRSFTTLREETPPYEEACERILQHVVAFNFPRLAQYQRSFRSTLDLCVARLDRVGNPEGEQKPLSRRRISPGSQTA